MLFKKIKSIVGIGMLVTMPFMSKGGVVEEFGWQPGSPQYRCYQDLSGGADNNRELADLIYYYASQGKDFLTQELQSASGLKHSVITWFLKNSAYPNPDPWNYNAQAGAFNYASAASVDSNYWAYSGNQWNPPSGAPYSQPSYSPPPFGAMPYSAPGQPYMGQPYPATNPSGFGYGFPQGAAGNSDVSAATPVAEANPIVTVKIDVVEGKTVQISFDGQLVAKLTYDRGLWLDEIWNRDALALLPLKPGESSASFEFGGVNFKVHINGDVEVFGDTPVQHCVLECPKEGKLIIPVGKELQVNRFVCLTRGKTIENFGHIGLREACFCFEQTIINHGEIVSMSQPGKPKSAILLLQSELRSDGGIEDVKTIHLKDRSYPEYGCQCFYGFDRSLHACCVYPNYPDLKENPNVFTDLEGGKRNFFYVRSSQYISMPFKGQTPEKDYVVPFAGDAVGIIVANGNHGSGALPSATVNFRFCESLSGRMFAEYATTTRKGIRGDSLNGIFRCKLTTSFKVYFYSGCGFMMFEGSQSHNYATPAMYFFKL